MNRIAIIGAGVTGLSAARALVAAGFDVTLFDKGRRAGGRMASRDGAAGSFDHGVQYLRTTAAEAAALGVGPLLPWPAIAPKDGAGGWIANPTFNHLAQHWAQGLALHCSHTVTEITRGPRQSGWQLRFAETAESFDCDTLLITIPTPQAIPLLTAAGIDPGPLAAVRYAPNWTLMWTPAAALPDGFTHHAGSGDDPLAWIAREDSKPGRSGPPRLTVQASAAWSDAQLELGADAAAEQLIALTAERLGIATASIAASAHRWRYAFAATTIGVPVVTLDDGLLYASDACLGSRVTLAFEAGRQAAVQISEGNTRTGTLVQRTLS